MLGTADRIFARDLVYDVIPKLRATENLVHNTLRDMIAKANNTAERDRHQLLQHEFELEIMMIHMNLDHLLKRHATEIQDLVDLDDGSPGAMLQLDQHERFGIESARQLYVRARAIQADQ